MTRCATLRLAAAASLFTVACGGARSSPRPDDCTADELGWTEADGCFFDAPAEFFAAERQDCGLSNRRPHPIALCHAPLTFDDDTVTWQVTDVIDSAAYECTGTTLTVERNDVSATWDADANVLVWMGLDYLPRCPR